MNVLHQHRVTHRSLTADRILFTADGQVMLLDPGDGDVAATDLQVRLDLAQLLAELALYVGPQRSADLALEKADADDLVAVVPLLQRVAWPAPPGRRCAAAAMSCPPCASGCSPRSRTQWPPVQLERIRLRTLVTLVATVAAVYLFAGELPGEPRPRPADDGPALGPHRAGPVGADLPRRDLRAVRVRGRAPAL